MNITTLTAFARPAATVVAQAAWGLKDRILAAVVNSYPQVVAVGALIGAVSYYALKTKSFDRQLQELVIETNAIIKRTDAGKKIEVFVEKNWMQLGLPESAKNAYNKQILVRRLGTVFLGSSRVPVALKLEKCRNICKNFTHFLTTALQTISTDVQNDRQFRTMFGIAQGDTIVSLKLLGDETHNRGQVPVMIELRSRKKLIFKPRSMITEELICGSGDGLFKRMGFEELTYHVHNKGHYGYSEYLENNENENTCATIVDVQNYLEKFSFLEAVATALRVSDLHCENVITRCKSPLLIDTEVVRPLNNPEFSTNLLQSINGGCFFGATTKNRIWFSDQLKEKLSDDILAGLGGLHYDGGEVEEALKELGVFAPTILSYRRNPPTLVGADAGLAAETQIALSRYNHRILLISTRILLNYAIAPPGSSSDNFVRDVEEGVGHHGYVFDKTKIGAIKECFAEDVGNNDVPIFYYNETRGEIYYHDMVIAKKKT